MSHGDLNNPSERDLWRRYRPALSRPTMACPDPMALAAFADRTLPEAERPALEEHLVECGECLSAAIEAARLAECSGGVMMPVPSRVLDAVKALVPEARPEEVIPASRWRVHSWASRVGWGVAAAAMLGVCVIGYQIGAASALPGRVEPDMASEMTFGLFDGTLTEDLALELMMSEGES